MGVMFGICYFLHWQNSSCNLYQVEPYIFQYFTGRVCRPQPASPWWAKVPLSSFFLKFRYIFPTFPHTFLIFFLTLALGPGYATGVMIKQVSLVSVEALPTTDICMQRVSLFHTQFSICSDRKNKLIARFENLLLTTLALWQKHPLH